MSNDNKAASNEELYRCLLRDLGIKLKTGLPSLQDCGNMKNLLLTTAEYPEDNTKHEAFWTCWDLWFQLDVEIDNYIELFRRQYEVLSFRLKMPAITTEAQEDEYLKRLIENNERCRNWVKIDSLCYRLTRYMMHRHFRKINLKPSRVMAALRNGPGACYWGEVGAEKHVLSPLPTKVSDVYPEDLMYANIAFASEAHLRGDLIEATNRKKRKSAKTVVDEYGVGLGQTLGELHANEVVSRITLVPKDYKGPRGVFITSKEVVMIQLAQQAIMADATKDSLLGIMYKTDTQELARERALEGSITGKIATLDLSDASDCIPVSLIRDLLPASSFEQLAATRPDYLEYKKGNSVVLIKSDIWAPMGDGKTFEVLSAVAGMATLAATAVSQAVQNPLHCRLSVRDLEVMASLTDEPPVKGSHMERFVQDCELSLRKIAAGISIIGDDISCPTDDVELVVSLLEVINFKVSVNKSFHRGLFREACGMDALTGVCITPFKQKFDLETCDEATLIKVVDLHNRMVRSDATRYVRTIRYMRALAQRRGDIGWTADSTAQPMLLHNPRLGELLKHTVPAVIERLPLVRISDCEYVPPGDTHVSATQVEGMLTHKEVDGVLGLISDPSYPKEQGCILLSSVLGRKVRWNEQLFCYEQKCTELRVVLTYGPLLDPWWSLNHYLVNGGRDNSVPSPYSDVRVVVEGSPFSSALHAIICQARENGELSSSQARQIKARLALDPKISDRLLSRIMAHVGSVQKASPLRRGWQTIILAV